MTIGAKISVDVQGGAKASQEMRQVAGGVDAIATAETKAAEAAGKRGRAQRDANGRFSHGGGHHFGLPPNESIPHGGHGGHGGFIHGLHVAGLAGGEIGHIGHRLGRGARFGAAGVAAGALGLAGTAVLEALESYDERMTEVIKKSAELAGKLREARKSVGVGGLSLADSQGLAMSRVLTQGGSFEDLKKAQAAGLNAGSLAELMGTRNSEMGIRAAAAARRFGMDPNAAAAAIAQMGGVRGDDPFAIAAELAGRAQNHRFSAGDISRARAMGGDQLSLIADINNRGQVGGINAIESGKAGAAAADRLNRALSPEAAAMTDAFKKATEESEVLHEIADGQNKLLAFWQDLSSAKGSSLTKAIRGDQDTAAIFTREGMSGAGAGGGE